LPCLVAWPTSSSDERYVLIWHVSHRLYHSHSRVGDRGVPPQCADNVDYSWRDHLDRDRDRYGDDPWQNEGSPLDLTVTPTRRRRKSEQRNTGPARRGSGGARGIQCARLRLAHMEC